MTPFSPSARYFLYQEPADMRKSFNGLSGLVEQGLGRDPTSGDIFVFLNRRRTHVKLLAFDRSGFVLYYVVWSKALSKCRKPGRVQRFCGGI